jgi:hypothetical protein
MGAKTGTGAPYSKRSALAGGMSEARRAGSHAAKTAAGIIQSGVEKRKPRG